MSVRTVSAPTARMRKAADSAPRWTAWGAAVMAGLGVVAPQHGAHAVTVKAIYQFGAYVGTVSALTADGQGNYYGTTDSGGTSTACGTNGCGTLFKIAPPASGQTKWTLTTLVNFDMTNGRVPAAGLTLDSKGGLYGTTAYGGTHDNGTIFKLTPPASAKASWTLKTLLQFNAGNGATPSADLVFDSTGSLLGTTASGGASTGCGTGGCGTVFKLTPPAAGKSAWVLTTLFAFDKGNGAHPNGGLVFDAKGTIYGTTSFGGTNDNGTVFALTPPPPGKTVGKLKTLANLIYQTGAAPYGDLVFDSKGNLYGTTSFGGSGYDGTVFRLAPPVAGKTAWTQTTLANFKGANGNSPYAGLSFDVTGHLYGTTEYGGGSPLCTIGCGTVFKLTPRASAKSGWSLGTLVAFDGTSGSYPLSRLVLGAKGLLYGTASGGGNTAACTSGGCGTVYQITP